MDNEAPLDLTLNVDNTKPKTQAVNKVVVFKGKKTTIKYKVEDDFSNNRASVVIKVTKGNETVKTYKLGLMEVNK